MSFSSFRNLEINKFDNLTSRSAINFFEFGDPLGWGPSMLIYAPFRKLLCLGGLECPSYQELLAQKNPSTALNKLVSSIQNANSSEIDKLLYSRTIFLMGFNEEAKEIFHQLTTSQDKSISSLAKSHYDLYLRSLNPDDWNPVYSGNNFSFAETNNYIVDFYSLYTHLIWAVTSSNEFSSAQNAISNIVRFVESSKNKIDDFDYKMSLARISRYLAAFSYQNDEMESALEAIDISINTINEIKNNEQHSYKSFLISEIKRRNLDFASLSCIDNQDFKKSVAYAEKATLEDPFCPRAQMILGRAYVLNEQKQDAIACFQKASDFGVLERPYSKKQLLELSDENVNSEYFANELIESDFFFSKTYKNKLQDKINSYNSNKHTRGLEIEGDFDFPVYTKQYKAFLDQWDKLNKTDIEYAFEYIKKSENYLRFHPYFEFSKPLIDSPDIGQASWYAYHAWSNNISPYYHSIALQRMPMPDFRENLIYSSIPNKYYSQKTSDFFCSIDSLVFSNSYKHLIDIYKNRTQLSAEEKSSFARCIGNLGFTKEALNVSHFPNTNTKWTIGDHYQANTYLFYKLINCFGSDLELERLFQIAFEKAPICEETLRSRFSVCMIATVYFGQRSNIDGVKYWRGKSEGIINEIINSEKFSDFNKNLLFSRYYRAVIYLPWLQNDSESMKSEAILCEKYARDARPKDETEELLNRDNLYSMLDSMQRIYALIGENDIALKMLDEVNCKIDKCDTKFWLSQGDFYLKNNREQDALYCFLNCGKYKAPLGRVGWYKSGEILENYGNNSLALNCYKNSVNLYPYGISPFQGIANTSANLKNDYLHDWATFHLNNYK